MQRGYYFSAFNPPCMKLIQTFFLFLLVSQISGQSDSLLIEQTDLSDISKAPFYPNLVEIKDGDTMYKAPYRFIDSLQISQITYLSDTLKVNGYMVKPEKEGHYPCIIYNRGGNRNFGALDLGSAIFMMGRLAREGYVVIASQYRGNAGGEGQEEFGGRDVDDVLGLVDVLSEVGGADTSRIGMFGWSRGGMMTYLTLTRTDRIKAAAVGGAPSDIHELVRDRPAMETEVLAQLVPDYETNREEALTKRSALRWADQFSTEVPILMMHGNADRRIKPEHSLYLALAFEKHRIPYRLIMFDGGDHGISEHADEVQEQVVSWFDRFVKNEDDIPDMKYHGR